MELQTGFAHFFALAYVSLFPTLQSDAQLRRVVSRSKGIIVDLIKDTYRPRSKMGLRVPAMQALAAGESA